MSYYEEGSNTVFMIIACSGAIVIGTLLVFWKVVIQRSEIFEWKNILAGFLLGVPNFLSLYFLLKALISYGNSAAFVFPIYNILSMLFSAITAYVLFKEKLTVMNRIGVIIAIIAVILLSYQELGL
jgi:drug/metabolite transporter (DMT)-like permease